MDALQKEELRQVIQELSAPLKKEMADLKENYVFIPREKVQTWIEGMHSLLENTWECQLPLICEVVDELENLMENKS